MAKGIKSFSHPKRRVRVRGYAERREMLRRVGVVVSLKKRGGVCGECGGGGREDREGERGGDRERGG